MALLSALSRALIFFTRVRFPGGKSALAVVFSLLSHVTISSTGCFENLPSDYFYFCGLMALLSVALYTCTKSPTSGNFCFKSTHS